MPRLVKAMFNAHIETLKYFKGRRQIQITTQFLPYEKLNLD